MQKVFLSPFVDFQISRTGINLQVLRTE